MLNSCLLHKTLTAVLHAACIWRVGLAEKQERVLSDQAILHGRASVPEVDISSAIKRPCNTIEICIIAGPSSLCDVRDQAQLCWECCLLVQAGLLLTSVKGVQSMICVVL